jgi:YidC/Oxa1 family membrane protein insertase
MKLSALLLHMTSVSAFVPSARRSVKSPSALSFGLDPSHFVDVIQQFTASSSLMLSDAIDTVSSAADAVTSASVSTTIDSVTNSADVVDAAAKTTDYGWFGFLTIPIEGLLKIIHSMIAATGTPNSWGVSIIVLTLFIKLVTFPLTKTQLESTNKMQSMQPAIKEIQLKYQSNPEVMNQKIAEFYQVNEINPLAGCFPSLVQIPVFIGLYRAVLELAQQNQLDERFLFLPNLEGPTYGADPTSASDWILKGWYVLLAKIGVRVAWTNFLYSPLQGRWYSLFGMG